MKALVLAGGSGTRLRPITYTSAKQLVPLANKPILFYGLEAIAAVGIPEVGLVVGDTEPDIRAAVGDGSLFGLDVTYLRQDAPRGLAHAVLIARDYLGDEPFVMYLGDNFLVGGISGLVSSFEAAPAAAQILLCRVDHPERFGVAVLDGSGRVTRLVEKPADPPSDLALVGVYVFGPQVHEAVRAIEPSARGELEITDAIQWLFDSGAHVGSHEITDDWIDTGKLDDLLEANRIVLDLLVPDVQGEVGADSKLEGRVVVEAGARIIRSVVRGPAIVGRRTEVIDSYIGPYSSVDHDCFVADAELEHSIVLEGSRIEGVGRITDSLIGRDVRIGRGANAPQAYRMVLGDHSTVEVQ